MLKVEKDSKGQPYIQWKQVDIPAGYKRAWIRHEPNSWAGAQAKRYLCVVRIDTDRPGIGGNPTDFPIFSDSLSDDQILIAFVSAVCGITSCSLTSDSDDNSDRGETFGDLFPEGKGNLRKILG